MDLLVFFTALSVGFLGSFHCAGMCGPIAIALPATSDNFIRSLTGKLLYNLGRVLTYSILGSVAGLIGRTFSVRGLQSNISILSGILILVVVLLMNKTFVSKISSKLVHISFVFKNAFRHLLKKKGYTALFSTGIVNGILPCGFVYLALAGAATMKGPLHGAMYMMFFGLGTLPMMLFISLSGSIIGISARKWINQLSPYIAIAMAVFLINRGIRMRQDEHSCCSPKHKSAMESQRF